MINAEELFPNIDIRKFISVQMGRKVGNEFSLCRRPSDYKAQFQAMSARLEFILTKIVAKRIFMFELF